MYPVLYFNGYSPDSYYKEERQKYFKQKLWDKNDQFTL